MKRFRHLTYIILIVLVLPLIYGYFNILPESTKYVLDLILVIYFIKFRNVFTKPGPFVGIYVRYIVVVMLIAVLSIIVHQESFTYLIPELRRLVIPLLIYVVLHDVFRSYQDTAIDGHRLFLIIMLIQIPVTIVQTILFPTFVRMNLFGEYRHYLDAATGTLGSAGHTYLGILIPLVVIYLYDLKLFKYILPFIIPLILINSGGGIVLFAITFVCIGVYSLFNGPLANRAYIVVGMAALLGVLIVFSQTEFFKTSFYSYTRSFLFFTENYLEGGRETFVGQEHKISRINGYKFLKRKMKDYDHEHLLGLGFSFKENTVRGRTLSYKNDLNGIIAERGFLGLFVYALFMLVFLWYIYRMLKSYKHKQLFIKMLFFSVFFIGGFYNQTSRSFIVWLVLLYYLVLLENKDQYDKLLETLKIRVPKSKRDKRKTRASVFGANIGRLN